MPQCVAANTTNASQSPDPPTPLIASIVLRERIVEGGIGSRVKHFFRGHFQAPNAIENGRGPNQRRAPLGKEEKSYDFFTFFSFTLHESPQQAQQPSLSEELT